MQYTQYQYWRHVRSGETYAVRLEGNVPTDVVGPLYAHEVWVTDPSAWDFAENPEDADWAAEHEAEFALYEGPLWL